MKSVEIDLHEQYRMIPEQRKKLSQRSDDEVLAGAAQDPDNAILTEEELSRFKPAISVRRIRTNLSMSQSQFAKIYHLSIATIRDWEQGRSTPDQSSRTLLSLIEKAPQMVAKTLSGESASAD